MHEVVGSKLTFNKHFVNEFTEFSENYLGKTSTHSIALKLQYLHTLSRKRGNLPYLGNSGLEAHCINGFVKYQYL